MTLSLDIDPRHGGIDCDLADEWAPPPGVPESFERELRAYCENRSIQLHLHWNGFGGYWSLMEITRQRTGDGAGDFEEKSMLYCDLVLDGEPIRLPDNRVWDFIASFDIGISKRERAEAMKRAGVRRTAKKWESLEATFAAGEQEWERMNSRGGTMAHRMGLDMLHSHGAFGKANSGAGEMALARKAVRLLHERERTMEELADALDVPACKLSFMPADPRFERVGDTWRPR